jgi:hypothetical protein
MVGRVHPDPEKIKYTSHARIEQIHTYLRYHQCRATGEVDDVLRKNHVAENFLR